MDPKATYLADITNAIKCGPGNNEQITLDGIATT